MPTKTKRMGKAKAAQQQRNNRTVLDALEDTDTLFGRTVKALGNCRFRVIVQDTKGRLNEEEASIVGRGIMRIDINDIVIVARSGPKNVEILGKMPPKDASRLSKEKRLHPALLTVSELDPEKVKKLSAVTAEEGFEFDYDGSEGADGEEADDEKEKHQGCSSSSAAAAAAAAAAADDEKDIAIDDI